MRYTAVLASIIAVAVADDFGLWSLYCGSSVRYPIHLEDRDTNGGLFFFLPYSAPAEP